MLRKKINETVVATCSLILGTSYFLTPSALAMFPTEKPNFFWGIQETGLWNSNPLMLRDNVQGIYGSETKALFGFQREMITSKLKAELAVLRNQFDQSEFNSTDFSMKTIFKKAIERWAIEFTGSYDLDTTRSSETTTFGQDIGSGRRNSYMLQPSIFYMVSPRAALGLDGRWQETWYDNETLTDFGIVSLTPAFRYNMSPLQIATLSFQMQRYSLLDSEDQYIDSLGPSLFWNYNFLPTWTLNLSAGYLGSSIHGYTGVSDEWDYNLIYGISLRHQGLQHNRMVSATKSRQPYADGTETYLTAIELSDKYTANENLDLEIKGKYQFATLPPNVTDGLETAWSGSVALNYNVGPNWVVNTSYKYREENRSNQSKSADQQILRVGLTYQFGQK